VTAREIVRYPAPVLSTPAEAVSEITAEIESLFDDLIATMYAENGVGVAAPQIGVGLRAIVIDADIENRGERILKLLNPEIVATEGEVIWPEGCLSIPGLVLDVKRHAHVEVVALDEIGREIRVEGSSLLGVALQHEIDHLDGKVMLDRVSAIKRAMWRKKIAKHGYPVEMAGSEKEERKQALG
jgi:peptide deformylase